MGGKRTFSMYPSTDTPSVPLPSSSAIFRVLDNSMAFLVDGICEIMERMVCSLDAFFGRMGVG